jgi:uncharacterized protein YjdB
MRTFILAVTGLALGVIACSSLDGTSVVIVQKTPVASVSLVLPAPSLVAGQKAKASATPRDASGAPLSDRPITWQSSSSAVASVTDSGMISAVARGSATISATSEGVSAQASISVVDAAPAPVASVSVALGASSLNPGQTTQATATTRDTSNNVLTGRAIAWSSSNTGIATVSSSGLVTAIAIGSAQITATSEGQSGSSTLTVTSSPPVPVASVTVALAASSRNPGQTTQATATTRDANNNVLTGRSISWSTSNSSVATVSGSGLVTAVAAGTAQIAATSEGQTGSATLTVVSAPPVPVASVSVALGASSLNSGQTTQATATTRDANNNVLTGRVISWSSSNTGVATVSGSGLVTAVAAGTAQITATSEGQSGSATLTVASPPVPVASVSVALASSSINTGQTTQATATTRDANNNVLTGRVITWSSSNTGVATVSTSGLVRAIAVGTVQIIASCESQNGNSTLTTTAAPVASVSVTLGSGSLNPGLTTQATATTRDANNNVLTGRVITWSSDNTAFATVSPSGLVTAVAVGTANITATSEGQSGSATVSVQVPGLTNEPSGMTVISDRPFNALNELGWFDAEYKTGNQTIVADATAPVSPPNVMRIHLPAGSGEGGSQGTSDYTLPNQRTLYVRYAGKFSSNWQGSSSGVDKTFYVYTSTGVASVYFNMQGSGVTVKVPQMAGQDMIFPGPGSFSDPVNPDFKPNLVPSVVVPLGTWHTIELVLVGNTAGNRDGSFDWYVNGVHVGSQSGIQFTTGAAVWNLFHCTLLYSGNVSSNPTNAQDVFFDHLYLSGKQ